jgi:hypothetical protein
MCGNHHDGHNPISAVGEAREYIQKGLTKKVGKSLKGVTGNGGKSHGWACSVNQTALRRRNDLRTTFL